jgi:hypothetical protein
VFGFPLLVRPLPSVPRYVFDHLREYSAALSPARLGILSSILICCCHAVPFVVCHFFAMTFYFLRFTGEKKLFISSNYSELKIGLCRCFTEYSASVTPTSYRIGFYQPLRLRVLSSLFLANSLWFPQTGFPLSYLMSANTLISFFLVRCNLSNCPIRGRPVYFYFFKRFDQVRLELLEAVA